MTGARRVHAWTWLLATPLVLPLTAPRLAGQTTTSFPPGAPVASPVAAVAVAPRAGATLVAVSVVIPSGSADDPEALPGAARLVAETVVQAARWRLASDAVRLEVRVARGETAFILLAAPEVWIHAWSVLADGLFRDVLPGDALEAARGDLLAASVFQEGAPVREFERELYRMVGGASPWSRDPQGDASSLQRASLAALEAFRARHYRPRPSTVAVVGPVVEEEARRAVAPVGEEVTSPARSGAGAAWEEGDRRPLRRDVTNGWIGAAFPAPPDLPRTQLEFLAHQMRELLNPSPPDPGIFGATVAIKDTPLGPLLVVEVAVVPEASEDWEERILDGVERLEDERTGAFFRLQRRRFRNAILLREAAPEESALRMALDLLRDGAVRALEEDVWSLHPADLAHAAASLGSPRVLVMGPGIVDGPE